MLARARCCLCCRLYQLPCRWLKALTRCFSQISAMLLVAAGSSYLPCGRTIGFAVRFERSGSPKIFDFWGERRHKSPQCCVQHSLRSCCRTRASISERYRASHSHIQLLIASFGYRTYQVVFRHLPWLQHHMRKRFHHWL